ncbi:MAG: hypothetical protein U0T82_05590 [Bacteroidales bacterium]
MRKYFLFALILVSGGFISAQNAPALSSAYLRRQIFCMLNDDSLIWLGTDHGIVRYNVLNGKKSVLEKGPSGKFTGVHSIKADNKGNKWILTSKPSIVKYTAGSVQTIAMPNGFSEAPAIYTSKDKLVLTSQQENSDVLKMAVYQAGNWVIKNDSFLKKAELQCMDAAGNFWFLHRASREIWKYDLAKWTNYEKPLEYSSISYSYADYRAKEVCDIPNKKITYLVGYSGLRIRRMTYSESGNYYWSEYNSTDDEFPGYFGQVVKMDKNQNVWIGTDAGYMVYRGEELTTRDGIGDIVNIAFTRDSLPVFLVSNDHYPETDNTLFDAWIQITTPDSVISHTYIPQLTRELITNRNSVYVHSDHALLKITDNRIDTIDINDLPELSFRDVIYDKPSGSHYFATDAGIYSLKNNEFKALRMTDDQYGEWIRGDKFQHLVRHKGMLYASFSFDHVAELEMPSPYSQGGLAWIDKGVVNLSNAGNGEIRDGEQLCSCDSLLWMNADDHRYLLYYWDVNKDRIVDSVSGIPTENIIQDVVCDKESGLYVVFEDQLAYLKNGNIKFYFRDSIPELAMMSIKGGMCDLKNRLWLIGSDMSLVSFSGGKWTTIKPPKSEFYLQSYTMDKYNRIWLGTSGGILMYDGVGWKNLSESLALPQESFSMLKYENDKVYAWSETLGILVFSVN